MTRSDGDLLMAWQKINTYLLAGTDSAKVCRCRVLRDGALVWVYRGSTRRGWAGPVRETNQEARRDAESEARG